eukprot:gene13866-16352_t
MSSQVVSPSIMGSGGIGPKRKLDDVPEEFTLTLKGQPLLVSSPLMTPVSQSPGLTSVQIAFQNASLSNPSTPLTMSPSLSPSSAPMSPSKKSKNSRSTSKSKWSSGSDEINRWQKVMNPGIVKGPWKEEEDAKLVELVTKNGPKEWSSVAAKIPGRIGKQCRERWFNHLSPDVRKTNWTPEEDKIIIDSHLELGNKWTAISKLLEGRPANAIKNHWNSTLIKRIGGDGKNHQPSKDNDDDEDDDDESNSPTLSPISLYPTDSNQNNNGTPIQHSLDSSYNSIPPFILSGHQQNQQQQLDSSGNSITNSPQHSSAKSEIIYRQGTIVAPQIQRLQNTPNTSPSMNSQKKPESHHKVPLYTDQYWGMNNPAATQPTTGGVEQVGGDHLIYPQNPFTTDFGFEHAENDFLFFDPLFNSLRLNRRINYFNLRIRDLCSFIDGLIDILPSTSITSLHLFSDGGSLSIDSITLIIALPQLTELRLITEIHTETSGYDQQACERLSHALGNNSTLKHLTINLPQKHLIATNDPLRCSLPMIFSTYNNQTLESLSFSNTPYLSKDA